MLRLYSYDIVFAEIPNEVTLAINISGCPNRCLGCHSEWLWEDTGEILDELLLEPLLEQYGSSITCVCFMGGDSNPKEVALLAEFVRRRTDHIKTAWYSGRGRLPNNFLVENFDYIKLGQYIESFGGLTSPYTNQRFYSVENGEMIDVTNLFRTSIYIK